MISQIQAGALDMAKVSASTLGNFSEKYNAFSVPYVFDDQDHYYGYMDSDSAQAVFESTDDQGFRGLTWLDSGARSFYTKAATEEYKTAWKNFEDEVLDKAVNENGVELIRDVDIAAFQEAVQTIYENLKTFNPTTYAIVEEIRTMA